MQTIIKAYQQMLSETNHPIVEVDGELKHRQNSLGKPIHSTDEGIKNFHRWFKDSVHVDEHGRPKVFYHGTSDDISAFSHDFIGKGNDQYGSGFYFSETPDIANQYAINKEKHPNVVPVYLKVKSPIHDTDTSSLRTAHIKKLIQQSPNRRDSLENFGDIDYEGEAKVISRAVDSYKVHSKLNAMNYIANDFYSGHEPQFLKNFTEITGHDGVISNNIATAFHPHQIKSAIGNSGKFNHPSSITESIMNAYFKIVSKGN